MGMIENDDVFDALAAVRRRKLLVGLLEHEPRHVDRLSETARELSGAHETYLREFLDGPMEIEGVEKATVRLHLVDHVDHTSDDRDANVDADD